MEVEPPLFSVAVWAELVEPTATFEKLKLVGETVTPVRRLNQFQTTKPFEDYCLPYLKRSSVAARAPDAVGLNTTVTVQQADAARLAPQVLAEILKSPEFVPVTDTLLIVIEVVPPFFNVVVCDVLVEPTVTVP